MSAFEYQFDDYNCQISQVDATNGIYRLSFYPKWHGTIFRIQFEWDDFTNDYLYTINHEFKIVNRNKSRFDVICPSFKYRPIDGCDFTYTTIRLYYRFSNTVDVHAYFTKLSEDTYTCTVNVPRSGYIICCYDKSSDTKRYIFRQSLATETITICPFIIDNIVDFIRDVTLVYEDN